MASHFGSDVTAGALQNRFRTLKRDALTLRDAVDDGEDCMLVILETLNKFEAHTVFPPEAKFWAKAPKKTASRSKKSMIRIFKFDFTLHIALLRFSLCYSFFFPLILRL